MRKKSKIIIVYLLLFGMIFLSHDSKLGYCHATENQYFMDQDHISNTQTDIIFLLDVSGSMKTTDPNKISLELIKLMIDVSAKNGNRVGFIGYNEKVAYQYILSDVGDDIKRKKIKNYISNVKFFGETDIGLGLKTALKMFPDNKKSNSQPILCMLSDGETDLRLSHTGRTEEQSQKDVDESIKQARQNNIKVYTIGLSNRFDNIVDYLETISSQTGGEAYCANSPFALFEIMNGILDDYVDGGLHNKKIVLANGKVQKQKITLPNCTLKKYQLVLFSTKKIEDVGILDLEKKCKVIGKSANYCILEIDDLEKKELTLYYQVKKGASISINEQQIYDLEGVIEKDDIYVNQTQNVKFTLIDKETKKNIVASLKNLKCNFWAKSQESGETIVLSAKQEDAYYELAFQPDEIGTYSIYVDYTSEQSSGRLVLDRVAVKQALIKKIEEKEIVICKGKTKEYDLNQLVESKWKEDLKFSLEDASNQNIVTKLQDGKLYLQADDIGSEKVTVIVDANGTQYKVVLHIKVKKFWKAYQNFLLAILMSGLIGITVFIYAIYFLKLKTKKAEMMEKCFNGRIIGHFSDLKSSNDIGTMEWDLREFPGVGVTLHTLLRTNKIDDYFLGAERIWIYPENESCITMVHSLNGSIFLGNKLIEKNTPVQIFHGDIVYICFEENGAEMELLYKNSGGMKYGQNL